MSPGPPSPDLTHAPAPSQETPEGSTTRPKRKPRPRSRSEFAVVPERRDASPQEIATILRAVMGFAPEHPLPMEGLAERVGVLPEGVQRLDVGAWIAWCIRGLVLWSGEPPTVQGAVTEVRAFVFAYAMMRSGGNLSAAAEALKTSRRGLRAGLVAAGVYPWPTPEGLVGREPSGE